MVSMTALFRPARLQQADQIRSMQERAMRRLGAAFYSTRAIEAFLSVVSTVEDAVISEGHYFVATMPCSRIVASGGWSLQMPHYEDDDRPGGAAFPIGVAVVRSVYVDPEMARRGLGAGIMRAVERDAASFGIRALTLTASLSGVPLYLAMGYRQTACGDLDLGGTTFPFVRMEKLIDPPVDRAVA